MDISPGEYQLSISLIEYADLEHNITVQNNIEKNI